MNITNIPFAKHIGIRYKDEHSLELTLKEEGKNHLGSHHAGALFTLAEAGSGVALQNEFSGHEGKVVAMLRSSTVKYKAVASNTLHTEASIKEEAKAKLLKQLQRKGKGTIAVDVALKDDEGTRYFEGSFVWYIEYK